ncbi:MAG: hypothetical protein HRT35_32895, partial [Algicola sp.]|nr:hypothetical protein [Algicola sp.]
QFDAVRKVVVSVVDNAIVAYLELNEGVGGVGGVESDVTGELRQYLKQQIPAFMIPSSFMVLDALPLTPNGKIDRNQLSELDVVTKRSESKPFEKPQSQTEEAVAAIWQQMLNVDSVSRVDGFFDVGGHSLMFVDMQKALHRKLGRKLTVVELLKHPTIASLAAFIDSDQSLGQGQGEENKKAKARGARQRNALRNQKAKPKLKGNRNSTPNSTHNSTNEEVKNGQPA